MRATNHSGRKGSASHNDRTFDVSKAAHINEKKMAFNEYGCIYEDMTFEEAERAYYAERFSGQIAATNAKAEKCRHYERMTDADKLYRSQKTKPEEVIFQIGDKYSSVTGEQLLEVYADYQAWHNDRFGAHVTILDWTLHVDEKTAHIHERRVWEYDHEDGYRAIGQHEALKALGYTLPDENAPRSRQNNLKVPYTQECREKWLDLCYEHGIEVERQPKQVAPNQQNMDKRDYIIAEQQRRLEELQAQLDEAQMQLGVANRILTAKNAQIERADEKAEKSRAKRKMSKEKVTISRDEHTELLVKARELEEMKAREEYVNQKSLETGKKEKFIEQRTRETLDRDVESQKLHHKAREDAAAAKKLRDDAEQYIVTVAEELVKDALKDRDKDKLTEDWLKNKMLHDGSNAYDAYKQHMEFVQQKAMKKIRNHKKNAGDYDDFDNR